MEGFYLVFSPRAAVDRPVRLLPTDFVEVVERVPAARAAVDRVDVLFRLAVDFVPVD